MVLFLFALHVLLLPIAPLFHCSRLSRKILSHLRLLSNLSNRLAACKFHFASRVGTGSLRQRPIPGGIHNRFRCSAHPPGLLSIIVPPPVQLHQPKKLEPPPPHRLVDDAHHHVCPRHRPIDPRPNLKRHPAALRPRRPLDIQPHGHHKQPLETVNRIHSVVHKPLLTVTPRRRGDARRRLPSRLENDVAIAIPQQRRPRQSVRECLSHALAEASVGHNDCQPVVQRQPFEPTHHAHLDRFDNLCSVRLAAGKDVGVEGKPGRLVAPRRIPAVHQLESGSPRHDPLRAANHLLKPHDVQALRIRSVSAVGLGHIGEEHKAGRGRPASQCIHPTLQRQHRGTRVGSVDMVGLVHDDHVVCECSIRWFYGKRGVLQRD
mmetsp:Transcript_45355/g.109272  ORF Transcript_45355/g.109272 Transcript_45355/m.109272 type:complete len:376 (-) Transcript_45355:1821-2948(-)